MIVDLVSQWCSAIDATDSPRAQAQFRQRHSSLLDALRQSRAPTFDRLPLATDPAPLRALAKTAADPATQQLLRDALAHASSLGADRCDSVTLLAGDGSGEAAEPLVRDTADAIVFVEQCESDSAIVAALARAVAALTRWLAPDSRSSVAGLARPAWNRWEAARDVALREWIYAEGVAVHLVAALLPEWDAHQLVGVHRSAYDRLRQREKIFAQLLATDLDQRGLGLTLRWLTPASPAGPRTVGAVVLPPMAGRYLGWRMTAERVERVGLREALRMEA